jgi:glycosyl transferase family 2
MTSQGGADVTIVIDTETEEPGHRLGFLDCLRGWRGQTRADRVLEYLVVSAREATTVEQEALEGLPARWLHRPALRYYELKNEGIRESRGAYVALSDSDTRPAEDWLERALEVFEREESSLALVTGRTRYLPGPFSRELALAQLPHQGDSGFDTTHFLAHNVLLRGDVIRSVPFEGAHIRLGADTHLAGRLIEASYRLRYEPGLRVTHNYARSWDDVYHHCVVIGYHDARFRRQIGRRLPGAIRDAVGRTRVLARRLRHLRRPAGIPLARVPLSLLFFLFYSTAVARGYARAVAGAPEPFAPF